MNSGNHGNSEESGWKVVALILIVLLAFAILSGRHHHSRIPDGFTKEDFSYRH